MRIGILFLCLFPLSVHAQSKGGKFDRPKPKASVEAPAEGKKPEEEAKKDQPPGEQKVDLTGLENQYWAAKDTEFTVVQNRLYTKEGRFSVMPTAGLVLSDPYTNNFNYGLAINYYFSERHGVELSGWKTASSNSEVVNYFNDRYGAVPDHNFHRGYVGVNYNWIPVYAKLSLLGSQILYFDFSISPGIGVTFLQAETFALPPNTVAPGAPSQSPLTFAVDMSQQVFLSKHWALKIDLRNHVYQERIFKAESSQFVKTKTTYTGAVMLGVTFFQ